MKVVQAYPSFIHAIADYFSHLYPDTKYYLFNPEIDFTPDLVVFSGGEDISPELYGEKNTRSYTNLYRDEVEVECYNWAKKLGTPMFGICRGHQLLCALNGGKLIQDIFPGHPGNHMIDGPYGNIHVNSMHHQGVITPGDFEVFGLYGGVYEIARGEDFFSVQFHPEFQTNENIDHLISLNVPV